MRFMTHICDRCGFSETNEKAPPKEQEKTIISTVTLIVCPLDGPAHYRQTVDLCPNCKDIIQAGVQRLAEAKTPGAATRKKK